jgi:hypothetical protein
MEKSIFTAILTLAFTLLIGIGQTDAENDNWHFQTQGVDRYLVPGETFEVDLRFVPVHYGQENVPNDGANNLKLTILDLQFDQEKLICTSVAAYSYGQYWFGVPGSIDNTNGLVIGFGGTELVPKKYYPDDSNNLIVTLYFKVKSSVLEGFYTDLMSLSDPDDQHETIVSGEEFGGEFDDEPLLLWKETIDLGQGPVVVQNGSYFYLKYLGLTDYGEDTFPKEQAEQTYYTGVASAMQALIFLDPSFSEELDQESLYETFGPGVPDPPAQPRDLNPDELQTLLNSLTYYSHDPQHPERSRYHFAHIFYEKQDMAIKTLIHWIDYDVPGVQVPNAPAHVPLNNVDGVYNWVTVRAFSSTVDPFEGSIWNPPADLTLRGLWLNDPLSDIDDDGEGMEEQGLGYNVYMTGERFKEIYIRVDDYYRFVAEPPPAAVEYELEAKLPLIQIEYAEGKSSEPLSQALQAQKELDEEIKAMGHSPVFAVKSLARAMAIQSHLAAIDYEEIIPGELLATPDFAESFAGTRLTKILPVHDLERDEKYNLLLFGKGLLSDSASVVLLVDDDEGAFQQATWATEEQSYISKQGAWKIAFHSMDANFPLNHHELVDWYKHGVVREIQGTGVEALNDVSRLVWNSEHSSSRFLPVYEIETSFGPTVYVKQDGTSIVKGELKPEFVQEQAEPQIMGEGPTLASVVEEPESSQIEPHDRFEQSALAKLPLSSVVAFSAERNEETATDRPAEIWIRISGDYSGDQESLMAQTATLYREITGYNARVIVTLWEGRARIKSLEF